MTEARKELREAVAIALSMVDPDSRGIPDGVTMAEFYRSLADVAIAVALERAAKVIEHDCHDDMTRDEEAAAIRALKSGQ